MVLRQRRRACGTTRSPAADANACDDGGPCRRTRMVRQILGLETSTRRAGAFAGYGGAFDLAFAGAAETKAKNLFLQKPKWWLFTLSSLLTSATSRRAREEMRRLSADRLIEKEVKRWLSEGPPEIVVSLGRAARANRVFVLVTFACLAYGVYDGLLMHSLASGLIVGILLAGLVNLATFAARKYRVKQPDAAFDLDWEHRLLDWMGTGFLWCISNALPNIACRALGSRQPIANCNFLSRGGLQHSIHVRAIGPRTPSR